MPYGEERLSAGLSSNSRTQLCAGMGPPQKTLDSSKRWQ